MPRTCTICTHPERQAIEHALLRQEPFRHIAARTGTSTAALQRHKRDHIPLSLRKAQDAEEIAQADTLLDQIQELRIRAMGILEQAERAGDLRTALAAIGQAKGVLELQARVTGETATQQVGNELPANISIQAVELFIQNSIALPKTGAGLRGPLPRLFRGETVTLESATDAPLAED